jgi:hypothetical protein
VVDFKPSFNVPEASFRVKTIEQINPDLLPKIKFRYLEEHSRELMSAIIERTGWKNADFTNLKKAGRSLL